MTVNGVRSLLIFFLFSLSVTAQPVASYVVKGDTNLNPVRVCKQYVTVFEDISFINRIAFENSRSRYKTFKESTSVLKFEKVASSSAFISPT